LSEYAVVAHVPAEVTLRRALVERVAEVVLAALLVLRAGGREAGVRIVVHVVLKHDLIERLAVRV